jgi:hypothetical protein
MDINRDSKRKQDSSLGIFLILPAISFLLIAAIAPTGIPIQNANHLHACYTSPYYPYTTWCDSPTPNGGGGGGGNKSTDTKQPTATKIPPTATKLPWLTPPNTSTPIIKTDIPATAVCDAQHPNCNLGIYTLNPSETAKKTENMTCPSGFYLGHDKNGDLICVQNSTSTPKPPTQNPSSSATSTTTPTPTSTLTSIPLRASLSPKFASLPKFAPMLGLEAQTLFGSIVGEWGSGFHITLYVRNPLGVERSWSFDSDGSITIAPGTVSDEFFGCDAEGQWTAWMDVTNGAQSATSNTAVWTVAFYPVHESP